MIFDSDEPRETSARVLSPCPTCAEAIPEDSVWVWQARFYCSEHCCRIGSNGY